MCIIETRTRHLPANPKGLTEYHTTLQVQDKSLSFGSQLDSILKAYSVETAGKEVLLRRFFLSDPANQEARLDKRLANLPAAATSIIGQPPLNGTKIAAWIYAVDGGEMQTLIEGVDASYLSTAVAGGFTGTTVGPYAVK